MAQETKQLQADTKTQEESDLNNFQAKDATLREELTRLKAELTQKKQARPVTDVTDVTPRRSRRSP